ncbi:MAG: hypothetical protein QOI58_4165 [Thermoanaerobaculia bacterium]|jgi:hypothetical protein|nr:hypothetical protein [Thermoanaerobaculia bacterium]
MTTKRNGAEETSAEFDAFTRLVKKVLSVPKSEILRREAEYKKLSDANPRKRGPKPKVKA